MRLQWERALQQLANCQLGADSRARLFEQSPSPNALSAISFWLQQKQDALQQTALLQSLQSAVDDSPFAIEDWLESLSSVYDWLRQNNKRTSFEDALGYIECSASMTEMTNKTATFPQMTEAMLKEHGFDAAT